MLIGTVIARNVPRAASGGERPEQAQRVTQRQERSLAVLERSDRNRPQRAASPVWRRAACNKRRG
jgi:hypothetical protein